MWVIKCGQEQELNLTVQINNEGLIAEVDNKIQQSHIDLTWKEIERLFIEKKDFPTKGFLKIAINEDNDMLIVIANSENHQKQELALSESQLRWFEGRLTK